MILDVFRNYVPNKYVTIDDKDPLLMNEMIKSKMKEKEIIPALYLKWKVWKWPWVYWIFNSST